MNLNTDAISKDEILQYLTFCLRKIVQLETEINSLKSTQPNIQYRIEELEKKFKEKFPEDLI